MRAIAFAILFVGFAHVVHSEMKGWETPNAWNVSALAVLLGATVCILGGW